LFKVRTEWWNYLTNFYFPNVNVFPLEFSLFCHFLVDFNIWILLLIVKLCHCKLDRWRKSNLCNIYTGTTLRSCSSSSYALLKKLVESELKTLEWDILNRNYLIWVSNGQTFDFLLKPFFWDKSIEKNLKLFFLKFESPSRFCI